MSAGKSRARTRSRRGPLVLLGDGGLLLLALTGSGFSLLTAYGLGAAPRLLLGGCVLFALLSLTAFSLPRFRWAALLVLLEAAALGVWQMWGDLTTGARCVQYRLAEALSNGAWTPPAEAAGLLEEGAWAETCFLLAVLALLALLPVHAIGLSGGQFLPWWRPSMLWERLCLLLWGLFGHLGAALATAWPQKKDGAARRVLPLLLGAAGALALLAVLVPVLASADALFAAATADLRAFVSLHFTDAVWKALLASVMTPFLFGLLYSLRRPTPLKRTGAAARGGVDGLGFAIVLAAVAALYLLFLGVQSAGLFGGAEYLAQKGLSYAEWARSGFFQMVGVTVVNLTLLLAAVQWSRREGGAWRAVRLLSALLTAESLLLLLSAAWRMTLYVDVYGLSFKRCMTYWGMGMMAAFLLAAAWKVWRPDFRFCRVVFPLALAGWLVINCVPVDYLVAKDQVDRYLSGESGVLDAEYLLYDLSYDTLSQLERLDGDMVCTAYGDWDAIGTARLSILLEQRRQEARTDCADWRTWSLSAWLASRGGA